MLSLESIAIALGFLKLTLSSEPSIVSNFGLLNLMGETASMFSIGSPCTKNVAVLVAPP